MERPVLLVDDRQDERFTEGLRGWFTVSVKHLGTGDLVWSSPLGRVGVEDKCFNDLVQSRNNGRLDDELRRLTAEYAVPILFVRGPVEWRGFGAPWTESSVNNLLFGRQLHGAYVYWTRASSYIDQAHALHDLWEYTQTHKVGKEGVRRERKLAYDGPLGAREEVIYGILGMIGGLRDRRTVAKQIASTTTLSEFVNWSVSDFRFAGFSRDMAQKSANFLHQMEASLGSTRRDPEPTEDDGTAVGSGGNHANRGLPARLAGHRPEAPEGARKVGR